VRNKLLSDKGEAAGHIMSLISYVNYWLFIILAFNLRTYHH